MSSHGDDDDLLRPADQAAAAQLKLALNTALVRNEEKERPNRNTLLEQPPSALQKGVGVVRAVPEVVHFRGFELDRKHVQNFSVTNVGQDHEDKDLLSYDGEAETKDSAPTPPFHFR